MGQNNLPLIFKLPHFTAKIQSNIRYSEILDCLSSNRIYGLQKLEQPSGEYFIFSDSKNWFFRAGPYVSIRVLGDNQERPIVIVKQTIPLLRLIITLAVMLLFNLSFIWNYMTINGPVYNAVLIICLNLSILMIMLFPLLLRRKKILNSIKDLVYK